MSRRTFLGFVSAAALAAAAAGSCSQDDGERCQIHSDCASAWCCKLDPAADHTTDGFCTASQAACEALAGADADADGDGEARTGDDAAREDASEAEPEAGEEDAAEDPGEEEAEAADEPGDAAPEADS
jgi:hypothetical protein